ncbi:MAG TPA: toll/interleukin-1 receptor domain-containing protein [Acidobacteriaceae bacterium]|jgi:hypothetical protein|nr:toll/interleukin-1 receptor domain-containing protein [Acidobacteriaceae bacterium]
MGRAIFISYRRDDSEGEAGRLFDDLIHAYGENSVFMDVAGINPGMDFRKAIDDNVAGCGVLLAIVGPTWATIANDAGQRRLDDDNDFVRLEIASALARDIPVIPVLVHDAKMPRPDHLPENLRNLAYRNSVELTHARWNSDVDLLTKALAQYVAASSATSSEPIHATIPVQLPPANTPHPRAAPAAKSRTPLLAGIAAVVVLAIVAALFFATHRSGATGAAAATPTTTAVPAPAAAPASAAALAGVWNNAATVERNGLKKLDIAVQGDQLSVHAWAQCPASDCDWGVQPATFDGQKATATWTLAIQKGKADQQRTATVTLTPSSGGLHVSIANTFSTGGSNQRQMEFVRGQ